MFPVFSLEVHKASDMTFPTNGTMGMHTGHISGFSTECKLTQK